MRTSSESLRLSSTVRRVPLRAIRAVLSSTFNFLKSAFTDPLNFKVLWVGFPSNTIFIAYLLKVDFHTASPTKTVFILPPPKTAFILSPNAVFMIDLLKVIFMTDLNPVLYLNMGEKKDKFYDLFMTVYSYMTVYKTDISILDSTLALLPSNCFYWKSRLYRFYK